jgi:hypothetical protein
MGSVIALVPEGVPIVQLRARRPQGRWLQTNGRALWGARPLGICAS